VGAVEEVVAVAELCLHPPLLLSKGQVTFIP